ncbi:MAG: xanthine dehydrogenase family protein [Candidatus Cloacimonetes bacterium]|nr:xanthine dehydrogenase family protein [Candidatus Cloacimonadota bacterium]MBS3767436.1 xanthine dehydrogenase family protein [Candidatus Cloacimonadota bacterium]
MKKFNKEKRVDAHKKIAGEEKYVSDLNVSDKLIGATIRSEYAHAKIEEIIFAQDFDWDDIVIMIAADIKNNYVAMIEKDMPFLAKSIVNYIGEPIVLLAAKNRKKLDEAINNIEIKYETLEPVLTFDEALSAAENKDDLIFKQMQVKRGNFSTAVKRANFIIEDMVETSYQEQAYMEPQGVIAIPKNNDKIEIRGSIQCPYYVQNAMDQLFADTDIKINVNANPLGGSFGGKEDFPSLISGHAALLAHKAQKPVEIIYDRKEDIKTTPKRHPSRSEFRVAVNEEGRIIGLEVKLSINGGAYCTLSPVVLERAVLTFGCYFIENICIDGYALKTNTVPNAAFRGFGGPQALFAAEMMIEKIAMELNLTPLEVRQINMLKFGDKLETGQPVNYSFGLPECLQNVLHKSNYIKKYKEFKKFNIENSAEAGYLKGIGMSLARHGGGFTGSGENYMDTVAAMELLQNGKLKIITAQTEMGQGVDTAYKKIVSDFFELPYSQILIENKDTSKVPNSGPTVASRSTMVVGKLIVDNCEKIKNKVLEEQDDLSEFTKKAVDYYKTNGKLKVESTYKHPDFVKYNEKELTGYAYPVFSWSANVAEIMLNLTTYEIEVTKYFTSQDIGRAINPQQAVAQIEGGTVQGIGYALFENMYTQKGQIVNNGFIDYIIPSIMDVPEIEADIVEESYFYGPYGAKGMGELVLVGVAPAIASALINATNKLTRKIPSTPEYIFKLLEE